ncbi:sensor histidine kinase [Actinoplanes teichomyceticus]|uniref:histidine kinase n=1 Tax=Actinoplanes teichomyceticus TaxID=1867 RepID=A0A561VIA6_ACTTI|nr:ATP-binding protein [Actinoplanes teichomyceticus]TWG11304.1 histidine kinase [Actinoplanes teichomyceticus]GIF16335.1 putative sensor histidine kinase [Actinoplanes teichomyceticus]
MRRPRVGLAGRLFAAQAMVLLVGAATLGLVTVLAGPAMFHTHLRQISGDVDPALAHHVEQAYTSATTVALAVGAGTALCAALAVSALVARRVAAPVRQLAAAAADIADGRYGTRVGAPGIGADFDSVAASFNAMAARLAHVEATRRRLLADLGHELRTPIATIEAYVEAAQDGVAVEDEDTWTVLATQTDRMRRLVEDIAAVSRAEEHQLDLRPVRVAPADLLDAAVLAARARYAAKGVGLHEHAAPGLPRVSADPQRIGQVLANLLDNALRHTPPGGRVTVTAEAERDGVRLAVADTGDGIRAEHLPHVFERFYRADTARDRDHGGSGIGLAVARAIVAEHGGRIAAASDGPGRGATFTVVLPAAR